MRPPQREHGAESACSPWRRGGGFLAPLRSDLNTLRIRLGHPADGDLVFPGPDGQPWRDTDWRNWRNRVFQPAAKKAGLIQTRPYDLRH